MTFSIIVDVEDAWELYLPQNPKITIDPASEISYWNLASGDGRDPKDPMMSGIDDVPHFGNLEEALSLLKAKAMAKEPGGDISVQNQ